MGWGRVIAKLNRGHFLALPTTIVCAYTHPSHESPILDFLPTAVSLIEMLESWGRGTHHGMYQKCDHTESRSHFLLTVRAPELSLHIMASINWGNRADWDLDGIFFNLISLKDGE